METHRGYDPAASLALVAVAVLAFAAAWFLPWWTMEARAPQYGQRTLVVEVGPRHVSGYVFEVDTLGHYVASSPWERSRAWSESRADRSRLRADRTAARALDQEALDARAVDLARDRGADLLRPRSSVLDGARHERS